MGRNAVDALLPSVRRSLEVIKQGSETALAHDVDPAQKNGFLHRLAETTQESVQAIAPAMLRDVVGDIDGNGLCMAAGKTVEALVCSHLHFIVGR